MGVVVLEFPLTSSIIDFSLFVEKLCESGLLGKYKGASHPSLVYTGLICYTCRRVEGDIARGYGSNIDQDALILRQFELAQNFLNLQRINDLPLNESVEAIYGELVRDIVELLKSRIIGSKMPKRVQQAIDGILSFPL